MFTICVDFDGTMVDHRYPEIGAPVPGALSWCRIFNTNNIGIILWTMRSGEQLEEAKNYMIDNGVILFGVNDNPTQKIWTDSRKVYSPIYIDDASAGCPLLEIPGFARPCVDWNRVGMEIVDKRFKK